jgi:prepilin-type N-terminal cleavage/methylation domain-containing protein
MTFYRNINKIMKGWKGFSLIEMMISLGIFAILIVMVTNLIILNLQVARRVKARTYVREESSFMLKIMKKDIRNSDAITNVYGNQIVITIDNPTTGSKRFRWTASDAVISRDELDNSGNVLKQTYRSPSDITFNSWESQNIFNVYQYEDNKVVVVRIQARDPNGMPEGQWMKKEVAVSTRNFQF